MKIESLWVYPIKSCAGISLKKMEVTKEGPKWDRHWMIVDDKGQFQTQRQMPKMALIGTQLAETSLILNIEGQSFEVPLQEDPKAKKASVKVWKSQVEAHEEDPRTSNTLSEFLNKKVRLVRSLPEQRQFHIRFADARPFHVVNLESLKALNQELNRDIGIERFRPNIVVSKIGTFAEDDWKEIEIGGILFKVSKACIRCNIINVDPKTGERLNSDPLIKLKEIHAIKGQPGFGVLLIPKSKGIISL